MKGNKLITLDTDLITQLSKVDNASRLINELLTDHFNTGGNMEKQEIEGKILLLNKEIDTKKEQVNSLKERVKVINEKETNFKRLFKGIPDEVMQDFKAFPKMTEDTLLSRYNSIYFGKVAWEKLIIAFREYFKDGTK